MPVYKQNLYDYLSCNSDVYDNPIVQKKIYLAILNGVRILHSNNIIHRDLKPQNILINSIDDIVICDFGYSKDLDSSESFTNTGDWFGTTGYMSPEQSIDSKHVDFRTDIFALGVILYDITCNMKCAPNQLQRIADKAKAHIKENRYNNISEMIEEVKNIYELWISNKDEIYIDVILERILQGKISNIELFFYVDLILNNKYYHPGDADKLCGFLSDKQYVLVEGENENLCKQMYELLWEDWINEWNGDYNKIDDMTSLVNNCWKISKSPRVKGFNLAKLADLAKLGNRYAAMETMANLISEISSDEQIKKELLYYSSANTIKSNYRKINRIAPAWI